jgi:hypothetical protein
MSSLPIHFFTIVLNGQPFIRYHLDRMKAFSGPWHWHIVEGLAAIKHDGAWALNFGGTLPGNAVKNGRSIDGTAEYLDQIAAENPDHVTIYRAPEGRLWDGKIEMVNAPLANITEECLLWEIDSDELWTTEQFTTLRDLFVQNPHRNAAIFYCDFLVGPDLAINRKRKYPELEWRRAWRYRPGMKWFAHEPPILATKMADNQWVDVTAQSPFTPRETEAQHLVFQHFAYVMPEQLAFKETYYGYKGITSSWRELQAYADFPVPLKRFFDWPWVNPAAMVDPLDICGIVPLAHLDGDAWILDPPGRTPGGQTRVKVFASADPHSPERKLGYYVLTRLIQKNDFKTAVIVGPVSPGEIDATLTRTNLIRLTAVDPSARRGDHPAICDLAKHGSRLELLAMSSREAAERFHELVDLVFIDNNRSQESVGEDLHIWLPKIRDDGIIAGYGFNHPDYVGVAAALRELAAQENLIVNREEEYRWSIRKVAAAKRRPAVFTTAPGAPPPADKHGRGVLMVKWGTRLDDQLQRAVGSVRSVHPELPVHVHVLPDNSTLLDKAVLYDLSPFEETVFLDLDTVVLGRLDFGFAMAQRHGLACCICENPWARRYGGLSGDLVEYNTGVLFFTPRAKPIFNKWAAYVRRIDSSTRYFANGGVTGDLCNDQAAFALAVSEAPSPPFVLPINWNFRPKWYRILWGPIKIWHDLRPIPTEILAWTRAQAQPDAIIQCTRFEKLCP